VKKLFRGPPTRADRQEGKQGNKAENVVARWPLALSVVSTTNHYRITSDATKKDKNMRYIIQPGNLYQILLSLLDTTCHQSNRDLSVVHPAAWWL
jgi:hypothetical protein